MLKKMMTSLTAVVTTMAQATNRMVFTSILHLTPLMQEQTMLNQFPVENHAIRDNRLVNLKWL